MNTTLPPSSHSPSSPRSVPKLIGARLGSYHILELIGRGGMAAVYKAYQPGTERLVALKVMLEHFSEEALAVQRFQQEARVIARLEHRNIVPVYDSGQQDGILYLVMRYMRAGTVQDIIARGAMSLRDASSIITDVAAALDYTHAINIIHRDIKPNNIMVDNEGFAYLTDFGLAKVLDADDKFTNTSIAIGTPTYMAPEQAMGQPVTAQTDIYAMGVMLYEMLTGIPPFSADSPMAVALMHIQQTLRPPREINPAISQAAEQVIEHALAKDPAKRYQSAGAMAAALAQAVEAESLGARPAQLAQVAGEIAETKGPEDLTPEMRRMLQQQDRAASRRRLLVLAPWVGGICLVAGLLASLAFTLNTNQGERTTAGQTATAVWALLSQLNSAQTAVAGGNSGLEPTLQYLQTQLAGGLASATSQESNTSTASPTQSATSTLPPANIPLSTPTPKPRAPGATNTSVPANTPVATVKTPSIPRTATARPTTQPTKIPPNPPTKKPAPTKKPTKPHP